MRRNVMAHPKPVSIPGFEADVVDPGFILIGAGVISGRGLLRSLLQFLFEFLGELLDCRILFGGQSVDPYQGGGRLRNFEGVGKREGKFPGIPDRRGLGGIGEIFVCGGIRLIRVLMGTLIRLGLVRAGGCILPQGRTAGRACRFMLRISALAVARTGHEPIRRREGYFRAEETNDAYRK